MQRQAANCERRQYRRTVMISTKNLLEFTVTQLKDRLRELDLPSTGNKAELINRLTEADPSGNWTRLPKTPESSATMQEDVNTPGTPTLASHEREIEMY